MDLSDTSLRSTGKALRALAHEAFLHFRRWIAPKRRPCVVILPSKQPWEAPSKLRAWLVAPELEALGWRVIVVPAVLDLKQRHRILALERPDIVLLQQTRHPLNQAHLYPGYRCLLDADDADYLDPRHQERIARCAAHCVAVIGGSRFVASCLGRHNPRAHVLWTCTPRPTRPPAIRPARRAPIVAWAHVAPLRYPHEAQFVQRVMSEVCARTRCTFWLFGSTEQEAAAWLKPIRDAGGNCAAIPLMSYSRYLEKVANAAVGLQPVSAANPFSQGKSFGKVLAYLSGQLAVVASNAVDHPLFFKNGVNGFVLPESVEQWADTIVALLEDAQMRDRVATAGWMDFQARLTTDVFAQRLDAILRSTVHESH